MPRFNRIALALTFVLAACGEDTPPTQAQAPAKGAVQQVQATAKETIMAGNTLEITLETGKVIIDLAPELAPNHVARIKELASDGFYDGVVFHRVIPGFMAQTGDPTGTGTGGSGQKLKAEFSSANFDRGTVGMARAASPDSADSQFFICFEPASHLNGQYTVVGKVREGMELIDGLKSGAPGSGQVTNPDKMISVRVLPDA